jgi:hypothetical protein
MTAKKTVFILETLTARRCENCGCPLWIVTADRDLQCLDFFRKVCAQRRPLPECLEIEQ